MATHLYGQEINAETYAICKADLLLKGSTLANDAFPSPEFDLMLSNPPYGKSRKSDPERMGGKDGIKDPRFGSRIAEMHNGSSLFTGDAGQGDSNIRRWIIEKDWLEHARARAKA